MRVRFKPTYEQRKALRAKLALFEQPGFALEFLRADLPAGFVPDNAVCTVMRLHPDRFVMRVQVHAANGDPVGYALKVYTDDFGEQVWAFTQALAKHVGPKVNNFCLPSRYDTGQHTLVFPWVEGECLSNIVDDRRPHLLRKAAEVAAALHRTPVVPAPPTTVQAIVAETRSRCDRLLHRWPEIRQIVEPLLDVLEPASAGLDPTPPAPIHGDLASGQFLWTGRRLVLLDLDMFGYADPAYDAGHFLAQLDRRCVLNPPLQEHRTHWLASFRAHYLAAMPCVSPRNLAFYHGLTLIRKIYTLCRTEHPEWAQAIPQLAQSARVALQTAAPSLDLKIPSGPAISEAEQEHDVLDAVLRSALGTGASLENWSAHPLSKRGKHRTVRYDLDARVADESQARHYQWLGMFYEQDDRARTVAAVLRELGVSDCGARGGVIIPRVLAYHAPLRLLLVTYETGKALTTALAFDPNQALLAVGRALAALHTTPVTLERTTHVAAVLDDLRERVVTLCGRFPGETALLQRLLDRLEQQAPGDPAAPSVLLGDPDLGPSQFLWQSGRIVVLNFDASTRGDPALDLGGLLVQLRRLTQRRPDHLPAFNSRRRPEHLPGFDSLRRGLLNAYQCWAPPDPGLAERVAWYEQVMLLQKIHFLSSDTTRQDAAERTEQQNAEAAGLLAELSRLLESADSPAEWSGQSPGAAANEGNREPQSNLAPRSELL